MSPETETAADRLREQLAEALARAGRAEANLTKLLAAAGEPGRCRDCGAVVYWVQHKTGRRGIYTPEGVSHFADCPGAAKFRRPKPLTPQEPQP